MTDAEIDAAVQRAQEATCTMSVWDYYKDDVTMLAREALRARKRERKLESALVAMTVFRMARQAHLRLRR